MSEVAVSVVVPALNAQDTLGATLDALADQDLDEPYEVIVVDNGSSDGTAAIAAAARGPVRLLSQRGGRPGSARNRAAASARAPVLAFTDADCVPSRGWLRCGLGPVRAGAGLVQGAVRPDPGAERRPFDRTVSVGGEGGLYETASMFVSREAFERAGGFEDWSGADVGQPFGEDVVFAWRARRGGARTAFCERALVHHAVFRRGPAGYVAERLRLAMFPALVARVPELRGRFLHRRWFLSRRSAAFDAAALGVAASALARPRGRRGAAALLSLAPLLAAVPYLRSSLAGALPWGRRAPAVAAVELAADAAGLAALASGSVRHRTLVL